MQFFSPYYRFEVWCLRYLRFRDLLQLGMLGASGALAVNAYSFSPKITVVFGGVYGVLLLIFAITTLLQRQARDYARGEVLWGLFSHMNKEIFKDDNRTRFTLFLQAPLRPDFIIPWYRYQKGATDPIAEAGRSKARYRRGEGFTGQAWENPGGEIFIASLPEFQTRKEFECYYVDTLEIDSKAVADISPHMVGTRTIISYGFTDSRGKFLGVLSLDLQSPVTDDSDVVALLDEGGGAPSFDADAMALIVRSIRSVLESFASIQKRRLYE